MIVQFSAVQNANLQLNVLGKKCKNPNISSAVKSPLSSPAFRFGDMMPLNRKKSPLPSCDFDFTLWLWRGDKIVWTLSGRLA